MVTIDQRFHHELEVFRNETEGCAQFLFALLSVHETLNRDRKVRALLNRAPLFWQTCLGALQTSTFIALGRIFDSDSPYNISKLMRLVTDHHFALFSKAALERRKMAGKTERPAWLDDYLNTAYEPTPADFRKIRKRVQKWRAIYESNYRDVRHQVFAHKEAADPAEVAVLFSKGNYDEKGLCQSSGTDR